MFLPVDAEFFRIVSFRPEVDVGGNLLVLHPNFAHGLLTYLQSYVPWRLWDWEGLKGWWCSRYIRFLNEKLGGLLWEWIYLTDFPASHSWIFSRVFFSTKLRIKLPGKEKIGDLDLKTWRLNLKKHWPQLKLIALSYVDDYAWLYYIVSMGGWDFLSPMFLKHISILRSFPEFRRVKCSHVLNKKPVNIPRPGGHPRDLENWWIGSRGVTNTSSSKLIRRSRLPKIQKRRSWKKLLKSRFQDNERVVPLPWAERVVSGERELTWITWGILEKVDLNSLWAPLFSTLCSPTKRNSRDQKASKIGWLSKVPTSTIERLDAACQPLLKVFFVSLQTKSCYYEKDTNKKTWLFKGAKAQLRHETSEDNELNRWGGVMVEV